MLFGVAQQVEGCERFFSIVDGIELRLDCFDNIVFPQLQRFIETSPIPILFTVRKKSQGGFFSGAESQRYALIEQLFALNPQYFDLEYDVEDEFLEQMASVYSQVKIIRSYHNFESTPDNLHELLSKMISNSCYAYKLATTSQSTIDTLRMMRFVREQTSQGRKVSGICMGDKGIPSRILGPVFGNFIDYSPIDAPMVPGQLTLHELIDVYHYKSLNPFTQMYGLIGNPVTKSLSHFAHNAAMVKFSLNAVYVKMPLLPEEIPNLLSLAKEIGFRGLSVTMPLKEHIQTHLDEIDTEAQRIGSVNTIAFNGKKIYGYNTDGIGALDALERKGPVRGKKVVLIGAGGAAKAIAYIAKEREADIVVLNRTVEKAKELARHVSGRWGGLENISKEYDMGYDILINCTPESLPIDPQFIHPKAIVMDIKTLPQASALLTYAKEKGNTIVYGYQMFINQAVLQQQIWFKERVKEGPLFEILSSEVRSRI